jgi:hypothetical protein
MVVPCLPACVTIRSVAALPSPHTAGAVMRGRDLNDSAATAPVRDRVLGGGRRGRDGKGGKRGEEGTAQHGESRQKGRRQVAPICRAN